MAPRIGQLHTIHLYAPTITTTRPGLRRPCNATGWSVLLWVPFIAVMQFSQCGYPLTDRQAGGGHLTFPHAGISISPPPPPPLTRFRFEMGLHRNCLTGTEL